MSNILKPYCLSLQDSLRIYVNLQISIVQRNLFIYLVIITVVVAGCSTYSSNPIGSSYHNLTAHYNAYFIANEHMKAIETELYDNFDQTSDRGSSSCSDDCYHNHQGMCIS